MTYQDQEMIGTDGKRESENSVLSLQPDEDNDIQPYNFAQIVSFKNSHSKLQLFVNGYYLIRVFDKNIYSKPYNCLWKIKETWLWLNKGWHAIKPTNKTLLILNLFVITN